MSQQTNSSNLIRIGFWCNTSDIPMNYPYGWPHPKELVDPQWESTFRNKIVHYLKSGFSVAQCAGLSYCRFPNCGDLSMGSMDLSDGYWLWPEGLAHYVENHHVRLPDKFIAHIKKQKKVPHQIPSHFSSPYPSLGVTIDDNFWIEWCAKNTPPPPPMSGALSFEQAREFTKGFVNDLYDVYIQEAYGRWKMVKKQGQEQTVDYAPPLTKNNLGYFLTLKRPVVAEDCLSIQEANKIATKYRTKEIYCQLLEPIKKNIPTYLRGYYESESKRHMMWVLSINGKRRGQKYSSTQIIHAQDEIGWRYKLIKAEERKQFL